MTGLPPPRVPHVYRRRGVEAFGCAVALLLATLVLIVLVLTGGL